MTSPNLPLRILLIDDSSEIEQLVRLHFDKLGNEYSLCTLVSSSEACDHLDHVLKNEDFRYDLILCDISFPNDNSGASMWQSYRFQLKKTSFVFMTGISTEEFKNLFSDNIDLPPIICKPIDRERFSSMMQMILKLDLESESRIKT